MAQLSPVMPARSGPVTDRLLDQLTRIAHDAPQSLASEAECEWLLATAAPLLEELRRWRAWAAQHAPQADLSNVVTLAAVRP